MSEMIERVARTMVARRGLPEGCDINWEAFRADARVAIEAMREPIAWESATAAFKP